MSADGLKNQVTVLQTDVLRIDVFLLPGVEPEEDVKVAIVFDPDELDCASHGHASGKKVQSRGVVDVRCGIAAGDGPRNCRN
jgi:hypothetical protein